MAARDGRCVRLTVARGGRRRCRREVVGGASQGNNEHIAGFRHIGIRDERWVAARGWVVGCGWWGEAAPGMMPRSGPPQLQPVVVYMALMPASHQGVLQPGKAPVVGATVLSLSSLARSPEVPSLGGYSRSTLVTIWAPPASPSPAPYQLAQVAASQAVAATPTPSSSSSTIVTKGFEHNLFVTETALASLAAAVASTAFSPVGEVAVGHGRDAQNAASTARRSGELHLLLQPPGPPPPPPPATQMRSTSAARHPGELRLHRWSPASPLPLPPPPPPTARSAWASFASAVSGPLRLRLPGRAPPQLLAARFTSATGWLARVHARQR
uniref:Uncharacterized protein n=1 Tax=Oryza punctata TaxID=4537 RepID=A0A0E0K315_ORYPU